MVSRGQLRVSASSNSIAAAGEGGSCGQAKTRPGRSAAAQAAICKALAERGEERKPCR